MSRGLSCPGYAKSLRWICGAVSKGPYRRDFYHFRDPDKNLVEIGSNPNVEDSEIQIEHTRSMPTDFIATSQREHYEAASLSNTLAEFLPYWPGDRVLLGHFTQVVASQLVWYDSDENPWRNLIVPLAAGSHTLLTAILALASGNIVARMQSSDHSARHYSRLTQVHRDNVLKLLSADFQTMGKLTTSQMWLASHSDWAKATLASTIILSYLEIHFPNSGLWRLHLSAAQQVMQAIRKSADGDSTSSFLAGELFAATTWSLLTDYDCDLSMGENHVGLSIAEDVPNSYQSLATTAITSEDSGFAGFCLVLRQITLMERSCYRSGNGTWSLTKTGAMLAQIDRSLSEARCNALEALRPERHRRSKPEYLDAQHLVDALYHATLIYRHRATPSPAEQNSTLETLREQLFRSLLAFRDPESFAQDQTWPLFVAGTESMSDSLSQEWIRRRFATVMSSSCTLDRPSIMRFLEAFWLQTEYENWIDYGRQRTRQLKFLIL